MKVAVLDDYLRCAREVADWSGVEAHAKLAVFTEPFASPARMVEALRDFDALCMMRDRTPMSASTLDQMPHLRFISFTGASNATLDLPAAKQRGIVVSHTLGGLPDSTAELAWALIMATVRQLPANEASLRAGRWQAALGTVLAGKTLGIIGLGRMGTRVAGYGRAFGMNVLAWSRDLTDARAHEHRVRRSDLDALLASSDVVTLHVPLSNESQGLIGVRELALMKPSAYLVNTSRGPLVDSEALIAALHEGSIAGAGLDVYDHEPVRPGDPMLVAPNLVMLPHLGFVSRENMTILYQESVENLAAWLAGSPIRTL
jgi:phosphoglycerate dehydrogenase-like enzyme